MRNKRQNDRLREIAILTFCFDSFIRWGIGLRINQGKTGN